MNERIKELMIQAKAEVRSEEEIEGISYDDFDAQVMEKFAELIVRECQSRVEQYIKVCGEIGCLPDTVIKKHFGVE
jgi:hypothetical protein